MSFKSLGLCPSLIQILEDQQITKPYPVQQKVIPAVLAKKDVLGIAQTGSGKTASYVLPVLMNLQNITITKNRHVNTLILVPTRELAIQVGEVIKTYETAFPGKIKSLSVYGGVSINPQMIGMQNVNVLVATPGRLIELIDSNAVHLSDVETLILDEADKMLNMGFKEEVDKILGLLPVKRQNLLFSATLNDDISKIRQLILNNPKIVKIEPELENLDKIKQLAYFVSEDQKGPILRYHIKHNNIQQVLVFTASTYKADNVADKLRKNGIDASAVHSKKSQGARTGALERFKKGELRVLVTTDLLARGIDVTSLPCVINYELPRSPKDYIHRIGRTGRADASGEAVSIISPEEEHHFRVVQKKMGKWVSRMNIDNVDLKGY